MISAARLMVLEFATRAAVGAVLALAAARAVGLPLPLYALIAAVLATDFAPERTRRLALRRLVGVVLGGTLGALVAPALGSNVWTVVLGALIAIACVQPSRVPETVRLAGFMCGIVALENSGEPWGGAWQRAAETGLGIVAAMLVSLVPLLFSERRRGRCG